MELLVVGVVVTGVSAETGALLESYDVDEWIDFEKILDPGGLFIIEIPTSGKIPLKISWKLEGTAINRQQIE